MRRLRALSVHCQQQRRSERPATRSCHRDLGIARYLPRASLAAKLRCCFVRKAEAVQATGADLAAAGVERQFAVDRNALTALDELVTWRARTGGTLPWWRKIFRMVLRRIVGVR